MDGPLFARPTVYHERGGRYLIQIHAPNCTASTILGLKYHKWILSKTMRQENNPL